MLNSDSWCCSSLAATAAEQFKVIQVLGSGTYGIVYKALDMSTGQVVALKQMTIHTEDGMAHTTLREVSLLLELRHANVVQ